MSLLRLLVAVTLQHVFVPRQEPDQAARRQSPRPAGD